MKPHQRRQQPQSLRRRLLRCLLLASALLCPAKAAFGADPIPTAAVTSSAETTGWQTQFDDARTDLIEGRYHRAETRFRELARNAPSQSERTLAIEMAKVAVEYAERSEAGKPGPRRQTRGSPGDIRGGDELTLLYASSFLYGAGAGTWFLLETEPTSGLTATLPFAGITALPVAATFAVDHFAKFPRGLPHALSAGLYVGLAQSVAVIGFQHSRADRIVNESEMRGGSGSNLRWSSATTAGVLWAGATGGALLGGALGTSLPTTPGRVSFAASSTLWSEALVGLTAAALMPMGDAQRGERAFAAGAVSAPLGLFGGLLFAGDVSPTVARVRIVDLIGIAGGLSTSGLYLAIASSARADHQASPRVAEGLFALGAVGGLATGLVLTSHMPKDVPAPQQQTAAAASPPSAVVSVEPTIAPTTDAHGVTFGMSGYLF